VIVNLDYSVSPLLYRVCYPQWSGYALEHDPTYIAYLAQATVPGIDLGSPPVSFIVVVSFVGSVALVVALYDVKKTRRSPQSIRRLLCLASK
jgi:hypothetical protein